MYGKIALTLAVLVSIACSVPIAPATFEKINSLEINDKVGISFPPDNGGNYGDNIWMDYRDGDELLLRQVLINTIDSRDKQWQWTYRSPGKRIVHIRFLNIGRERAYVEKVSSNGKNATAIIDIEARKQFRLLVEVYGE